MSSQDPRTKAGLYWGYTVRLASCLSKHRASSYEHLSSSLCLGDLRELQTGILILLTCFFPLFASSALPGILLRTPEAKHL